MPWWLWIFIGVVALVGESVSMTLFLLYVGVAAFITALITLTPLGAVLVLQVGIFLALSLGLLGVVRPRTLNALARRLPRRVLTNEGALIDREATVVKAVTNDSGMVRVGSGEFWSARTAAPGEGLPVGSMVRILYITGLTAIVAPLAQPEVTSGVTRTVPFVHTER